MRCYTWNVNGIRSVAKKNLLPWSVLGDGDVICLQETKAQVERLEAGLAAPEGWHSSWHSAVKPGYSSVAIISRPKPDEVVSGIGDEQFDCEGRVLAARYGTLVVISAYFPNSRDGGARLPYKLAFCARLEAYLAEWRAKGCETLLMGDYNIAHQPIDLARPKENVKNAGFLPDERAWMTRYLGLGYHDVFRAANPDLVGAYTWWTAWGGARDRNVGWRIDLGTVSPGLLGRVRDSQIHPEILGSDHCPVSVELS
jgi:exodeoxyribonuclease-3